MFENIPVDKVGLTNTRQSNFEYLGSDMIEGGNEFGVGTPYGKNGLSKQTCNVRSCHTIKLSKMKWLKASTITTFKGSALIRVGQTEQALGVIEREYIRHAHDGMCGPLSRFLEGEMRNITRERKVRMLLNVLSCHLICSILLKVVCILRANLEILV